MRRDYFILEVDGIDWIDGQEDPSTPTLIIDYTGPGDQFRDSLMENDEEMLESSETDVALRLQTDIENGEAKGVVSMTNRITGDFILELNESVDTIVKFIRAARRYGKESNSENGRYRVRICIDGDEVVSYEKATLLVYDMKGQLLRQHSLIPSGIEL